MRISVTKSKKKRQRMTRSGRSRGRRGTMGIFHLISFSCKVSSFFLVRQKAAKKESFHSVDAFFAFFPTTFESFLHSSSCFDFVMVKFTEHRTEEVELKSFFFSLERKFFSRNIFLMKIENSLNLSSLIFPSYLMFSYCYGVDAWMLIGMWCRPINISQISNHIFCR